MLYIKKKSEPAELTRAKRDGLKRYGDMPGETKKAIVRSLLEEQGGLCAYCMKRIKLSNLQIEHYHAQSCTADDLTIDYDNMLGVCSGNSASAGAYENLTCDRHRGNTALTVNPLDENTVRKIKYKSDGTIYSDDMAIETDLNETLNLNSRASYLKENRKAALDAVKRELAGRYPDKEIPKAQLEKMLTQLQTMRSGSYETEFAGAPIWYLKQRIARP